MGSLRFETTRQLFVWKRAYRLAPQETCAGGSQEKCFGCHERTDFLRHKTTCLLAPQNDMFSCATASCNPKEDVFRCHRKAHPEDMSPPVTTQMSSCVTITHVLLCQQKNHHHRQRNITCIPCLSGPNWKPMNAIHLTSCVYYVFLDSCLSLLPH